MKPQNTFKQINKPKETHNGLMMFGVLGMLIPSYAGLFKFINLEMALLIVIPSCIIFCASIALND